MVHFQVLAVSADGDFALDFQDDNVGLQLLGLNSQHN
jgi:hypothetical protein